MIRFIKEDIENIPFDEKLAAIWLKQTAAIYKKKAGDITYILCSDDKIIEINRQFLQHDYYTDVITFDYSTASLISGDIFVSVDTVRSNADNLGVTPVQELFRVFVHGLLHLCGQDDKTFISKSEMTGKENEALSRLDSL